MHIVPYRPCYLHAIDAWLSNRLGGDRKRARSFPSTMFLLPVTCDRDTEAFSQAASAPSSRASLSCDQFSQPHPASGFACTLTLSITHPSFILPFLSTSTRSIFPSTSIPPITLPKTVFFPSKCGAGAYVMKN